MVTVTTQEAKDLCQFLQGPVCKQWWILGSLSCQQGQNLAASRSRILQKGEDFDHPVALLLY